MSIKQKLVFIAAASALAIAVLGACLYASVRELDRALEKNRVTIEITKGAFDRRVFLNEYLAYHLDRAKNQWLITHDQTAVYADSQARIFTRPEERVFVSHMTGVFAKTRTLFLELVSTHESTLLDDSTVGAAQERRLENELLVMSQAFIADCDGLREMSEADTGAAYRHIAYVLVGFILGLFACSAIALWVLWRSIITPLYALRTGIARVADGDFGYRVGTDRTDEIGELSRSFDDMTARIAEVDKAKTEFVSLASHELRTPLTAIGWYTEMMLRGETGPLAAEQKKYLGQIAQGNERMTKLVQTLLSATRIELGKFSVEAKPIDPVGIATDALREQAPQIRKKALAIRTKFSRRISIVSADPNLLYTVLQNLLSNAVKYTPAGGSITFSLSLVSEDPGIFRIRVADTGYGIPKRQGDKVFSKLFRADNILDKDTDGTGLGLYIVKSMLEHIGGRIWFRSSENKGTTFYAEFPFERIATGNT